MNKLNILIIGLATLIASNCTVDPYELHAAQDRPPIIYPAMLTTIAAWDMMIWRVSDECYDTALWYDVVTKDRPLTCAGVTDNAISGCTTFCDNEIAVASDLQGMEFEFVLEHETIHVLADCEQGALAEPYHYDAKLWMRISTEDDPRKKKDNENKNNVEAIAQRMLKRDRKHSVLIVQEE